MRATAAGGFDPAEHIGVAVHTEPPVAGDVKHWSIPEFSGNVEPLKERFDLQGSPRSSTASGVARSQKVYGRDEPISFA